MTRRFRAGFKFLRRGRAEVEVLSRCGDEEEVAAVEDEDEAVAEDDDDEEAEDDGPVTNRGDGNNPFSFPAASPPTPRLLDLYLDAVPLRRSEKGAAEWPFAVIGTGADSRDEVNVPALGAGCRCGGPERFKGSSSIVALCTRLYVSSCVDGWKQGSADCPRQTTRSIQHARLTDAAPTSRR